MSGSLSLRVRKATSAPLWTTLGIAALLESVLNLIV